MDFNDILTLLLLCCVVPIIVTFFMTVAVFYFASRQLVPTEEQLQKRYAALARSGKQGADLIDHIVREQATRAGIVGAVTSVGGILVLPFGLILDLYATTRIQEATLRLIARANGITAEQETLSYVELLNRSGKYIDPAVVAATSTAITRRMLQRLLREIAEKAFAKLIPGLGLMIGYAVNYYSLRGAAEIARRYYR